MSGGWSRVHVEPYECPKGVDGCGELHTGCRAHNRAGMPCGAQPLNGTAGNPRCRYHLGTSALAVRAKYEAERQAERLYELAQTAAAGRPDNGLIDPLAELHELASEVLRWRDVCRQMVGELGEIRYRSAKAGEQVRAEIVLYTQALDRAERILVDIHRLGLEDRMAARLERDASDVEALIERLLEGLGLDSRDRQTAAVVASVLRSYAASLGDPAAMDAPAAGSLNGAGAL